MSTINKWRIYCNIEQTFVESYLIPGQVCTTCPNNTSHNVNNGSASIVSSISPNVTQISTQDPGVTNGNFRAFRRLMNCAPNCISTQSTTFPYTINILDFNADISASNVGDMFESCITSKTPIGILATDIPAGSITFPMPFTFISNVQPGFQPVLINPNNGFTEEEPEILSIDYVNNQVTLVSPTITTFTTGSYVNLLIKKLKTYYINSPFHLVIGNYLRASTFTTNLVAEIRYTNNSNVAKTFVYGIDYLY